MNHTYAWVTATDSFIHPCRIISFQTRAWIVSAVIVTVGIRPTHRWWVDTFIDTWNKTNDRNMAAEKIKMSSLISSIKQASFESCRTNRNLFRNSAVNYIENKKINKIKIKSRLLFKIRVYICDRKIMFLNN